MKSRQAEGINFVLSPSPTLSEQRKSVAVLDTIDHKIHLHQGKRAVLEDLFKVLQHRLMMGEICVGEFELYALGETK